LEAVCVVCNSRGAPVQAEGRLARETTMFGKWFGAFVVAAALVAGCGKAEIGEACEEVGKTDECVENAVCDTHAEHKKCHKVCSTGEDCAATENCNGISGSNLKACHPKP
jgi:hypothetical protein